MGIESSGLVIADCEFVHTFYGSVEDSVCTMLILVKGSDMC